MYYLAFYRKHLLDPDLKRTFSVYRTCSQLSLTGAGSWDRTDTEVLNMEKPLLLGFPIGIAVVFSSLWGRWRGRWQRRD